MPVRKMHFSTHRHLTLFIFLIIKINTLYLIINKVTIAAIFDLFETVTSAERLAKKEGGRGSELTKPLLNRQILNFDLVQFQKNCILSNI